MLNRKTSRRPRVTPSRPAANPEPREQALPLAPDATAAASAPVPAPEISGLRGLRDLVIRVVRPSRRARRIERPPAATPRNVRFRLYISYRWLSAALFIVLVAALYLFLTLPIFFIRSVDVAGTRYFEPREIVQRSELANTHVLWVDPAAVEALLMRDPSIARAEVRLGWFPNLVQINITEREPALLWEQGGARSWLDVQGRVMALRAEVPDLVTVRVENPSKTIHLGKCALQGTEEVLGPQNCIDENTVAGALAFKTLYPDVMEMIYNPDLDKGLGFRDGRGWILWFGDGTDIQTKMLVYVRIVEEEYTKKGNRFGEVNMTDPDAPFYSIVP